MAKTQKRNSRKKVVEPKIEKPIYKGQVIVNEFSIKDKTYRLGDEFSTESKFNYDTLIKQKRIK